MQEHVRHVATIFSKLRDTRLKVYTDKCQFAVDKIDFLGHTRSVEGLSPQEEKVSDLR